MKSESNSASNPLWLRKKKRRGSPYWIPLRPSVQPPLRLSFSPSLSLLLSFLLSSQAKNNPYFTLPDLPYLTSLSLSLLPSLPSFLLSSQAKNNPYLTLPYLTLPYLTLPQFRFPLSVRERKIFYDLFLYFK